MKKLFLLLTVVLTLTGCGEVSKPTEASNEEEKNDEYQIISTEATYIGLIDPHSIEVMINNEPLALQINQEQMKLLEPLPTNESIYIEYYYNEKTSQYILKDMKLPE